MCVVTPSSASHIVSIPPGNMRSLGEPGETVNSLAHVIEREEWAGEDTQTQMHAHTFVSHMWKCWVFDFDWFLGIKSIVIGSNCIFTFHIF